MRADKNVLRAVGLSLCLASAVGARADMVTLKDGTVLTGDIIAQGNDGSLTLRTRMEGLTVQREFLAAQIAAVQRVVKAGPGYCAIPLTGGVGEDFTAKDLSDALTLARAARPAYVVLVIDSTGGQISEMKTIVDLLENTRDVHLVAYVKKALSAASVIAAACPTIIMAPRAQIGSTVPWKMGPAQTPTVVEEKFLAAFRAYVRSAASARGHSPWVMDGMIDPDLELQVSTKDKHPEVIQSSPLPGAWTLKRKNEILCMTTEEAQQCGLAAGSAETLEKACVPLGLTEWHQADSAAWFRMTSAAKQRRQQFVQQQAHSKSIEAQNAYVEKIRGTVEDIDQQMAALRRSADDLNDQSKQLNATYDAAAATVDAAYQAALAKARTSATPDYYAALATEKHDADLLAAKQKIQSQLNAIAAQFKAVQTQFDDLKSQRQALINAGPKSE